MNIRHSRFPLMTAADEGTPSGSGPTSASGRVKVAEKDYDEDTGTFSIVFTDGSKAEVVFDELPPAIQKLLGLHGLAQKLGDSYASVKGDVEKAKERFSAVLTQLQNGEWKKAREGGDGGSKVTELAEAIARFKNASIEKANAVVAKATKEQIAAWRNNAKIKAIIAQIRAEKAAERAAKGTAPKDAATDADLEALDLETVGGEAG